MLRRFPWLPAMAILACGTRSTPAAADPVASDPAPPSGPVPLFTAWPGCELSAAQDLGDGTVLLGDNEDKTRLAVVSRAPDGTVAAASASWRPLARETGEGWKAAKVEDIEALAAIGRDVWVFGSHSRSKWKEGRGCLADATRTRAALARVDAERVRVTVRADLPDDADDHSTGPRAAFATIDACKAWLGGDAVCAAVVAAEQSAGKGEADGCEQALNLEGAAAVGDRVWVGLRAPVPVEGGAFLLRVAKAADDGVRFDQGARVKLPPPWDRYGVRALDVDGAWLYGISGPTADSTAAFVLWRAPTSRLADGAVITPTWTSEVPNGAEGLVVRDGKALMVFDGEAPGSADRVVGMACPVPSRQLVVPVPG